MTQGSRKILRCENFHPKLEAMAPINTTTPVPISQLLPWSTSFTDFPCPKPYHEVLLTGAVVKSSLVSCPTSERESPHLVGDDQQNPL